MWYARCTFDNVRACCRVMVLPRDGGFRIACAYSICILYMTKWHDGADSVHAFCVWLDLSSSSSSLFACSVGETILLLEFRAVLCVDALIMAVAFVGDRAHTLFACHDVPPRVRDSWLAGWLSAIGTKTIEFESMRSPARDILRTNISCTRWGSGHCRRHRVIVPTATAPVALAALSVLFE